jgi:tetratricopeptide (TPR) repeat protein
MRLLKLNGAGQLSLIKVEGNPKYAILSHTWGADGDEVTFEDLVKGNSLVKNKLGYHKIKFCVEQAARDGLLYSWIDTCCINKADFTELSMSINSMFRWYREATRCYVYLSDVPNSEDPTSTIDSSFPKSRWFTRGWTLQELVAPAEVQFYSVGGQVLGDKKSLERQIYEITGISIEALQGRSLSQFSVTERLSWAARRQTTVEEDAAYCLLGIFDTYMPLIYGEGREKALARLQREIQHSSNPALLVSSDATWIVPFERNPCFTGRETQLALLEEKLFAKDAATKDTTTRIAITGLGGIGKTQLVLELLYRTKEKHPKCSVIWVPANTAESLHQGYLNIARQLEIPGFEDAKMNVKKLVQDYLSKDGVGQWLLVFDNADDMDIWMAEPKSVHQDGQDARQESGQESSRLADCLPQNKHGCIIFTSRDRQTVVKLLQQQQQNIVEVPEMNEGMAAELLKKCIANADLMMNKQGVMALLEELTYLPLAIIQAAAYINKNWITPADYLSLLKDREEEITDLLSEDFEDVGRYRDIKNPVATTWLVSFDQIRRRDPLAEEYLSFMACIDPKDIPQSLLPPGPSRKKEIDAIGTLSAYPFVGRRPVDLALDLHRLVHLATRNWLRTKGLLTQWMDRAIVRLEEVFPDDDHKNRSVWRMYLPHVRYILESNLVDKEGENRLDLMMRYGRCLHSDGRWNEAEVSFSQVLEAKMKRLGADHPDTLSRMAWLASTYRNQGRWEEAEQLEVQVMETRKRKFGNDHPDTLSSMANLASTYSNQGRWEEAEQLEVQVMKTRKRKLGDDHPSTLISMSNLASTYRNQGRWEEAEQLEVQVMETFKRKLGDDHPSTLTSMGNLALTYRNQGRWEEAEELDILRTIHILINEVWILKCMIWIMLFQFSTLKMAVLGFHYMILKIAFSLVIVNKGIRGLV